MAGFLKKDSRRIPSYQLTNFKVITKNMKHVDVSYIQKLLMNKNLTIKEYNVYILNIANKTQKKRNKNTKKNEIYKKTQ